VSDYSALVAELNAGGEFLVGPDRSQDIYEYRAADAIEALTAELAELRRNTGHLPNELVAKALAYLVSIEEHMDAEFSDLSDVEYAALRAATFEVTP
jgi:hypothetical protein